MVKLDDAIENVLNEARILLLGTQVLLGFGYRICFEQKFEQLPPSSQVAQITGLGIMTAALGWLIWPAALHQIREDGAPTKKFHGFASKVLDLGLFPLAVGLPLTVFPVAVTLHIAYPWLIAIGVGVIALGMWYAWSYAVRDPQKRSQVGRDLLKQELDRKRKQESDLAERIKKVLIECRMALPGAQAFLGFQFAIVFAQGFDKLPHSWQIIHFLSLLCMTVSIVLLIAPAAYHRLAEAGDDTEHFHTIASRLMLTALVFLAPGMAGDLFVVIAKLDGAPTLAGWIAGGLLTAFYALWFGYSSLRKK
jgi:hypothetical protein